MGHILIKPGVDFGPALAPAGAKILEVLKRAVREYPFNVTITSARDGVHSGPNDPHKLGCAFDLRTHGLTPGQRQLVLNDLQRGLCQEPYRFTVFLEAAGTPNEHIHCQRRKGETYTIYDYLADV